MGGMCILSIQRANSGMKSNKFKCNSSLSAYGGSPQKYIIGLSFGYRLTREGGDWCEGENRIGLSVSEEHTEKSSLFILAHCEC